MAFWERKKKKPFTTLKAPAPHLGRLYHEATRKGILSQVCLPPLGKLSLTGLTSSSSRFHISRMGLIGGTPLRATHAQACNMPGAGQASVRVGGCYCQDRVKTHLKYAQPSSSHWQGDPRMPLLLCLPLRARSRLHFPEGGHCTASLPSDLAELQKEASVSTEHCLASGRCGSSCPEPPTDKNHKQLREKPWGAGEQAKVEPDRKEGVCTPTAEEGLSCPDQTLLLPQQ